MSHSYFVLLRLIELLFPGVPLAILVWALWRWSRTSPKVVEPAWRSYLAFAAIGLAGTSTLIWLVMFVWARIIGGFGYYDPILLGFHRWGFLTGTAGFVISFAGKGKLRWPSRTLSLLMALLWRMTALSQ